MSAWRWYEREIATAGADTTARALAETMGSYGVGCLVIVDDAQRPLGIVTDRDLACRVVARGADPDAITAIEIATKPVQVAKSDEPIEQVVAHMRKAGVRRMPVVEGEALSGLVTLDDLVVHLGRELNELGSTAKLAVDESRKRGRRERRRRELEEGVAALEATALASGRDAVAFVRKEIDSLRERLRGSDSE
jgi:signal-transduction protein with cAMP-binding, CBS, and nucleotidyltransferase domain